MPYSQRLLLPQRPQYDIELRQWRHLLPTVRSGFLFMGRSWTGNADDRVQHLRHVHLVERDQRHSLPTPGHRRSHAAVRLHRQRDVVGWLRGE